MDLTDIYRVSHPPDTKCVFFSAACATFPKMNILDHKASLKYNRIKIIDLILPDHDRIILETNNKRNHRRRMSIW